MRLAACVAGMVLCAWLAAWQDAAAQDGRARAAAAQPLTIALSRGYPPFSVLSPDGTPAGLLVDIWELWAEQTGTPIRFMSASWNETLELVRSGKAQVHAGLFRSASREGWLDFSDAIYEIPSALYVPSSQALPSTFADMRGRTIGCIGSTFQHEYLAANHPAGLVKTYGATLDMVEALVTGKVDAVLHEVPNIDQVLVSKGWRGLVQRAAWSFFSNSVHAAVPEGNTRLLQALNEGFAAIEPEALANLERRWIHDPASRVLGGGRRAQVELSAEEAAYVQEHPVVTLAASPHWPPFEMEHEGGAYAGIAADYARLAAAKVGLRIEPVFDPEWDNHVTRLKNRELDAVAGLNETPSRLEYLTFTKPYIEYFSAVFARRDREDIKGLDDLEGKVVALEKGYAIARNLPRDHPGISIKLVDNTFDAIAAVQLGQADAYIGNQVVASYMIKKYTLVDVKPVSLYNQHLPGRLRIAVRGDRPLLRGIFQKGLDAVTDMERDAIMSTYLDAAQGFRKEVFSLREADWEWLKEHPVLRVWVRPNWLPFSSYGQQGEPVGIASEYVAFVRDKLKVGFAPTPELAQGGAAELLAAGNVDVAACVAKSRNRARAMLFTRPYLTYPIVAFSRDSAPLIIGVPDLTDRTVAVVRGHVAHELLAEAHPGAQFSVYDNADLAARALSVGEVEFFATDIASGFYAIESQGLTNLKVAASTPYQMEICMAVRRDAGRLRDILDSALAVVGVDEANEMKSHWVSMRFQHGVGAAAVLKWVLPIGGGLLVVLAVFAAWNRRLDSEINQRIKAQAELEIANTELRRLARIDGLTQVFNRAAFDETLDMEWRRMQREGQPLSLVMVDVDYFKKYNDAYGHQAGDDCLVRVARAMRESVRRPSDMLARYGGEEFAVILVNTDARGAAKVAEAIAASVRELNLPHGESGVADRVTLSMGTATLVPDVEGSPTALVSLADQALYRAKEKGRNRIEAA